MIGLSRTRVHCKVAADDPGLTGCIELADRQTSTLLSEVYTVKKDRYEQVKFHFDSVLPADCSPYDVFQTVGKPAVKRFVKGVTSAVVTYGQSGVGKTHSLFSNAVARGNPGLVQQCLEEIYTRLLRDKEHIGRVSISALSVYQDKVTDLLHPKRPMKADHVSLNSATSVDLQGVSHAIGVLAEYALCRMVSPASNPKIFGNPSRGHFILVLTLNKHGNPSQITQEARQLSRSHLFIVDLPGSERVRKSGVTGTYLEEAKHINHSLFIFGQCLQSERGRRPYRDSILTLVLHPLFSTSYSEHSSEINILALISGKTADIEETISTLTFAQNSINQKTEGEALPHRPKEEAVYLRNLVEERERQITDKDAKMILQNAENEELRHQIEQMMETVKRLKEKNEKLKENLGETNKKLTKMEDEKEGMTRNHRSDIEKRLKEEAESLERQKEMEMTEFRIKTATEVSQAFASKVQQMTAEHESTVTKLMEALMEKQKQEQKLIALVHKEQDENRRLRGEISHLKSTRKSQSSSMPITSREASPAIHTDDSQESIIVTRKDIFPDINPTSESQKEPDLQHHRFSSDSAVDLSPKPIDSSSSSPPPSHRLPIDSVTDSEAELSLSSRPGQDKSLLFALKFVFTRIQNRTVISKLDRKARTKQREIWLEEVESFINSEEIPQSDGTDLWGKLLGAVTVVWSTTSRLKRRSKVRFAISEINDLGMGQKSPGFERNGLTHDKVHLSLWVRYRQTCYFEVIFSDRQSLVLWAAGLELSQLALNTPNAGAGVWQTQRLLLEQECGMPR